MILKCCEDSLWVWILRGSVLPDICEPTIQQKIGSGSYWKKQCNYGQITGHLRAEKDLPEHQKSGSNFWNIDAYLIHNAQHCHIIPSLHPTAATFEISKAINLNQSLVFQQMRYCPQNTNFMCKVLFLVIIVSFILKLYVKIYAFDMSL